MNLMLVWYKQLTWEKILKNKDTFWMVVSGATGFAFFLIANFTNIFVGASFVAGLIQLCANIFVFVTWTKAFINRRGFKKFVASFGVFVPVGLGGTTIYNVIIPQIISWVT